MTSDKADRPPTTDQGHQIAQDFVSEIRSGPSLRPEDIGPPSDDPTFRPAILDTDVVNTGPNILPKSTVSELLVLKEVDQRAYYREIKMTAEDSCLHHLLASRRCKRQTSWYNRWKCQSHESDKSTCYGENLVSEEAVTGNSLVLVSAGTGGGLASQTK
ncbi:hypothetical protein IWQ60_005617 [Tieghemiomyces parasiticus]|uniref:Uncharacterized protein n=1 Tax=Tieghemiomyces parasiticus TaxID=78921 RepID=A0A9W8AC06_9FUNG|nr:hypothetical protein IWQ60_005617 [Tieghemiomyces parasiticus]